MDTKSKSIRYRDWYILAIIIRFFASLSHAHWFHPDEWCQTFEPASILANGFGIHSQEIGLHLRNLTWPAMLGLILKISQILDPLSIQLRVFLINFTCGLLDLGILWGWIQLLENSNTTRYLSTKVKYLSLALLILPWFTIYESVSPRVEHISEIAFWISLGFLARKKWFSAGFGAVAVFAFRYPSALLSAGIGLFCLFPEKRFQNKSFLTKTFGFLAGAVVGISIFGIADWVVYGRPWESFWLYLEYNVFSGSSSLLFGKQEISEYLELFKWNWGTYPVLLPIGIFAGFSALAGLLLGLKNVSPWAICFAIYLIGHLLVPHKEGRFMIPIETTTRWAAFLGAVEIAKFFALRFKNEFQKRDLNTWLMRTLLFLFGIQSFIFLHHLRADLFKERGTYLEVGHHLKTHPNTCAIVTSIFLNSVFLPFDKQALGTSRRFSPAVSSFHTGIAEMENFSGSSGAPLIWIENGPSCKATEPILLHVYRAEPQWTEQRGCTLLPSGVLKILPSSAWSFAIQHGWVKGPWYSCPSTLLTHFKNQKVIHYQSFGFGKLSSLPKIGISPQDLQTLGRTTAPPPEDSVLPDVGTKQLDSH